MATNKLFYTIRELAEGCGYTRQRIYQLIDFENPRKSMIKAVRIGHTWLIPKKEFRRWQKYAVDKGEIKKYNFFPRVRKKESSL